MWHLDPQTIRMLVKVVSPDAAEVGRIARTAEHDEELLTAILEDPRLHSWLLERPHEMVFMAPEAFFAALLYRVRHDLATRTFTHERESGRMVIVFDIQDVRELMEESVVIAYLSWMLASFVRIHTVTRTVRVRRATWRKYTVSDFDIGSLLRYVHRIEPQRRPVVYRRIGEVALFQAGILPERTPTTDLVVVGTDSYQKALEGGGVDPEETDAISAVTDGFLAASKALAFMSEHYLGPLRTKVFEPQVDT